jgi:glutamate-1-semialdehyde 2,1-aminomutase
VFDPHLDDAVGHGGTFSANPVTMSAGLASLRALDEGAIERINRLGDRLRQELASQGHAVSGRGSLLRLHPADPTRLWWELYEQGVLISANGLACMSTPMDDSTVERALAAFARVARDASPAPEPKAKDAHV